MSCGSDVMDPIEASSCCTPQDMVAQAARAMSDSGCGCAPVVEDTENLKLVGVASGSGWFAARPSGTENIYKNCADSFRGQDHLRHILDEGR